MNDARERSERRAAMEAVAAEWLVKQDRGFTPPEQDEFLQWLAADAAHRESFVRHRQLWRQFDRVEQHRPTAPGEPDPDLLAPRRRPPAPRWRVPVLLAAAAAVAIGIGWSLRFKPAAGSGREIVATSYQQEELPDGSSIDLNRGARVVVQFSSSDRRVLLESGEAQFAVAKDPARPFVVRAGGVEVRAVGTAFNVKLSGAHIEVLVTEGTVHVSQRRPRRATGAVDNSAPVLAAISAGQRTTIPVAPMISPPVIVSAGQAEIAELLHWKPRLLDFEAAPLAEVVASFNRANPMQLIIADEGLRELPIVASIRSDNVEGFVRLLEATMGVRAEREAADRIVLRRAR